MLEHSPILVTGAAGFIGSHLVERLLAQGGRVVGVDNFCDFYAPAIKRANVANFAGHERFTMVEADIRDRAAMMATFEEHQPAGVVHLAAMAGVRPSIERPDLYTGVNVNGTVHLLDAAVAHGVDRFVFASSSSVYGNHDKVPFHEDDRVDHPISPYAATKAAGELLTHTYWHIHRLPMVCLRFFTVFGPRQRPDLAIARFLRMIAAGQAIPVFGDGTTSRDYTYIDDIVTGVVAALAHCTPKVGWRMYNLGGSAPVSLAQMIATIEKVVGKKAVIDRKPMQPGDVQRTYADVSRAAAELGYKPKTSLERGIAAQWGTTQALAGTREGMA